MTAYTAREVRAWAAANNVPCSTTGKVPRSAVDAYLAAHDLVAPEPDVDAEIVDESPGFTVTVTIPGNGEDGDMDVAQHIVEALYRAFEAGRQSALEQMRAVLA